MKETILVAVNKEGTLKIATLKTICNLHKNFVGLRGLDSYSSADKVVRQGGWQHVRIQSRWKMKCNSFAFLSLLYLQVNGIQS